MNTADLPGTPRSQFESLTGKRADLLLPQHAGICFAWKDGSAAPGDAPLCFGVWHRAGRQALLVVVGGPN